jgi:hypothetical protein
MAPRRRYTQGLNTVLLFYNAWPKPVCTCEFLARVNTIAIRVNTIGSIFELELKYSMGEHGTPLA